jgi:hypothetical protein
MIGIGLRRVLAQVTRQREAVHVGQAQRRGHQREGAGLQCGLGFLAGLAADEFQRLQLLPQHALDHLAHDLRAVHHHDARRGRFGQSKTGGAHTG